MIIRGYNNSTAQEYANKYEKQFEALESDSNELFVYGDFDDNGIVDITDLSWMAIQLVDKKMFTDRQKKSADVTGNGIVDIADLAHLRQYISKKINWLGTEVE